VTRHLVALLLLASACTPVPVWDRARLAHPTMRPGSLVGVGEGHVHDVQEGARGGSDSEGGGCGCN
jgi:hypothetical protein